MKSANQPLALAVAVLCGALVSGCSSGAHSMASGTTYAASRTLYAGSGPVYLAQSAAVCTQADTTMTCLKGVDVPEREEDDDGEEREDWREYCRDTYVSCIDMKWQGNCSDCLRRCEGQRGKWPKKMCFPPTTRRRR